MTVGSLDRFASCLMVLLGVGCASGAAAAPKLELTIAPQCAEVDRCVINLELSNNSEAAIELYESLLPWKWYGSTLVAAERKPGGEVLRMFLAVDDPSSETVLLAARAKLKGVIDLNRRFPTLQKTLRERDVIIFLSYDPAGPGASEADRVFRSVVLKAAK